MLDLLFLFGAGLLGGIINSLAGGGSFITFPSLMIVGVSPVTANASNTFAACAGYISGTWALRSEIKTNRRELARLSLISAIAGGVGAYLLTLTNDHEFEGAIPWLLLFATLLFIFGGKLNSTLRRWSQNHSAADQLTRIFIALLFIMVSVYGGFFNAGLGIVLLSYLSLAGYQNINEMNALKLLYSSTISLCAIVIFVMNGLIAWTETGVLLTGTVLGGFAAGHLSKHIPALWIRWGIIVTSSLITLYFFVS